VSGRNTLVLWGVFTTAMGLVPTLASFNVIATDDSDFGAPRWLVAALGHLFMLAGLWLTITRAPDWPLAGLLRVLMAPLMFGLCALFCVAVVLWPQRVQAGPATRDLFLALAVLLAVAAGGALAQVVRRHRRLARR
jgi:peptidoglycan/LPS O-acetylase OafA/YrhL